MSAVTRRRGVNPYIEVQLAGLAIGLGTSLLLSAWGAAWIVAEAEDLERPAEQPWMMVFELLRKEYVWPGRAAVVVAVVIMLVITTAAAVGYLAYKHRDTVLIDRAVRYLAKPRDLRPFVTRGARESAARLGLPDGTVPGVYLGKTVGRETDLWGSWEDMHVDIWGPRTGKTSSRAIPNIVSAPGAVVVTSNKRDVLDATRGVRETKGQVWVFDPQGQASEPAWWYWDPLQYVGSNIVRAIKMAGRFSSINRPAHARSDAFFEPAAEDLISHLLLAASLGGRPITQVYTWLTRPNDDSAARILRDHAKHESAEAVESVLSSPELQRAGVFGVATQIMSFLVAPSMTEWVTPGSDPDRPKFDYLEFVKSNDTIYMMSEETSKAAAPLIVALTAALAEAAENESIGKPNGRLPIPMLFVLDEAANVCPWGALPDKYSHFGSRGIVMMTILQSWAQGVAAWGDTGMKKLWGAANVRVYGGGAAETDFLGAMAKMSGVFEPRTVGSSGKIGDRPSYSMGSRSETVLDESDLASMPRGRAFVMFSGSRPVLIKTVPWWTTSAAEVVKESIARFDPGKAAPDPAVLAASGVSLRK
ncbi:type IV secretory system conjugative DNA transfer family protein [Yinghuangia soli]|uniref:TraM recognition domain-containing protein n=1 Tax=Yinghuangia soli TaxID=2908204 RepID=A0AA41TZ00_9ACTN|nr:TraM recognition domain-containing protein [Yinghuangia soli]MCF2526725.1 TraM recognition domain-containing protein [Yinghuangia soli]